VNDFTGSVQQQAQEVINEIDGVRPTIVQVTDNTQQISDKIEDNQDTVIFFLSIPLSPPIDYNDN